MTAIHTETAVPRVRSRQPSPVPRTQLGILPVNQRSYSRRGSKSSIFGDESPLMSPLPFYPRRRSVTFAGDREERPYYNSTFSASAPVSPTRSRQNSPPPASILKNASSYPISGTEDGAGATTHYAAPAAQRSRQESPVPQRRGRSASRQRLAARRREAQLHHSFYDDSFVEEFVLSAKSEMEKEDEQRRLEAEMRREEEKAKKAEQRAQEATEKINALQHAKEVLQAAAKRRRTSVTPSPTRARPTPATATVKEANLLKSLEEDSDPEIQSALDELARASLRRKRSTAKAKRSMPLVSEDALLGSGSDLSDAEDEDDAHYQQRKRARLEKIVSSLLSQQKKSKSKHSVVVINWSDTESGIMEDTTQTEEEPAVRSHRSQSVRHVKSRSAAPSHGAPSSKAATRSTRRAASSRARQTSEAPDLGADSALFSEAEENKPILLPRRQHKRPQTTRSLSQIDAEMDDLLLDEEAVQQAIRKPPRAPPRARRNTTRKQPSASAAPRAPVRGAVGRTAATHRNLYDDQDAGEGDITDDDDRVPPVPPPRRRAPAPRVTNVSPDDPMAVFFDAAFPSPSKFDEMMLQAGGLADSGRGGRGGRGGHNGRGQPNLVLPSTIGRRR